jgi:hypothetical protein
MASAGVNTWRGGHASTVWRERVVDVDVSPLDAGCYLEIVVHGPGPDQRLEYIVDAQVFDEAVGVGLGLARDFIDGRWH